MFNNDNFCNQSLREKFHSLGITHKEVANSLGVSVQSIYNLSSGRTNKQSLMYKVIDFLNNYQKPVIHDSSLSDDFYNLEIFSKSCFILSERLKIKEILELEPKILLSLVKIIYKYIFSQTENNDKLYSYVDGIIDGYINSSPIKRNIA